MNDQTRVSAGFVTEAEARAQLGDMPEADHPRRPLKLDQIAAQHRENYNAEARRSGQPEAQPEQRSAAGNVDYGSTAFEDQHRQHQAQLTYAQRAMRGDFGEDVRQQAVAAYNRGEELQEDHRGPLDPDRLDGSQLSTTLHQRPDGGEQNVQRSNDLQTIASQQPGGAADAGAQKPAAVTAPDPVSVAGESNTKSKTVTTVDGTKANTPPPGGTTVKKG